MLYHIDTEERLAGGRGGTVYTLYSSGKESLIEVWPSHGFNCLRWRSHGHELLFAADDWIANALSTRSGIPILFPFPNRIRDGVYKHHGRDYRLAKNDSTNANAIHGFAVRNPWRVFGYGTDGNGAWVHADFRIAKDAPEADGLWPGDAELAVLYRLGRDRLRIEMQVTNLGSDKFPFGIGLHPYFRWPTNDADISRYLLHAPARSIWPLTNSLPTGNRSPVTDALNYNRPRTIGATTLDTVYGDLGVIREEPGGLLLRATLGHTAGTGKLEMWTTADFGDSVLFTPQHRKAICWEPYTCVTDAVNLQARGINAGWLELNVGAHWLGVVEFRWDKGA